MKTILKLTYLLIALIPVCITGCKEQLKEDYYNPDGSQTASMETLFGKFSTLSRYHMQYWDLTTLQKSTVGVYTQIVGYQNGLNRYNPSDTYVLDHWNRFYTEILQQYREMETKYNALDETKKADYKHMMIAADAILINELVKKTDMWGEIPFSEAGYIRSSNQIIFPKFDTQQDIYNFMINRLRENAAFLVKNPQSTPLGNTLLTSSDFIYAGNTSRWQKFTNSLRLRLLVRVKGTAEMGASANQEISTILNNPVQNPLIESNADNAIISSKGPNLFAIDNQHEGGPRGGFSGVVAGKAMLDVLKKGTFLDPRLQVMFSKNRNGNYAGINPLSTASQDVSDSLSSNLYSFIDSTTMRFNNFLPGVLFTAAETQFLKAEILQGAAAETAFKTGIKQSIDWYYYVRNLNTKNNGVEVGTLTPPTDAQKEDVATYYFTNYYQNPNIGKDEAIGIQRWIHFGPLQMYEAWSDMRRYNHPVLRYLEDSGQTPKPLDRFKYPSKEYADNMNMSQQIKDNDKFYNKVWWDK
ncbi:SusD/RagB family nutrient-binding outer membrane lipoprotein [Sphingobacterium spiritivorum]|uniref:SusD/RagB family nutrient-binding outer membrane lipoprotein n=1 Tax=Sphingobacterium spiritivorum TaxID=258 RepID=UPI003DA40FD5